MQKYDLFLNWQNKFCQHTEKTYLCTIKKTINTMAKILGLDLGTNSIGWAVIDNEKKKIVASNSRIIPMDAGRMGDFETGNTISQTADRTKARGARRLYERFYLRRQRLLRVLKIIGYLPEHYASTLDRYGNLPKGTEPKLAWREGKEGKPEFLFKSSFNEMVADFRREEHDGKIPYDWTIYYLRHKGLSAPLSKEELAWVLMQFNQKRGYYQLRGKTDEEDSSSTEKGEEKEYHELLVVKVENTGEKDKKGRIKYNILFENGWLWKRTSFLAPDWEGKKRPIIATFKLDKDGKRKEEQPSSFSSPDSNSWGLRKIKTQRDIDQTSMTVGDYIYHILLHTPEQKIIGEAVRTIDRSYYHDELVTLLRKQTEFHPELTDRTLYQQCTEELYSSNEAYRNSIAGRDLIYLLVDDILFYQRPLKSKKDLITDCPYECYEYLDHNTNTTKNIHIKCIAKSHPLFQEFRLWQFLSNLRIYKNDQDITTQLLPDDEAYADLYDYLSTIKEVDETTLLRHFNIEKKKLSRYRWNNVRDKKYPMGETHAILLSGLKKAGINPNFLTSANEEILWHILYSIDDPKQYKEALHTFARKQGLDKEQRDAFVQSFLRLTIYKDKAYGAYSAKATKRLLKVMRRGRYWSADAIDEKTKQHIEHMISGEVDNVLTVRAREALSFISSINQCQGLAPWQACYLVYGRHSEAADTQRWKSPEDINRYLEKFRHHSLNNPVVEQVVTESLRIVRDIWLQYGRPDEIHIELGRELKKTAAERERMSKDIAEGEATNQRIRLLLSELKNPDFEVANVRPNSPSQQELLKIYEEGVFGLPKDMIFEDDNEQKEIESIRLRFSATKNQPTHAEVLRYKLWLDQKYRSPYTGRIIPLGKLFTTAYQIEHIIPQSRWFDDSLSNKVICESEVNKLKDRLLGHEFIVQHHGEVVPLSLNGQVEILSVDEYEKLVKETFASNRRKREKLMLDDIPESFTSRQMNDSRYISRLMMHLLSNIVRTEDEEKHIEDAVTSKNVIALNGKITDRLKHDWGVNDTWNRIILPRFERLNQITSTASYTALTAEGHTIPQVPLELRQGFSKKRIDHRHHAMDAIVIACCTRDHVNLLNNESAKSSIRYDLNHKLRRIDTYPGNDGQQHETFREFIAPWPTFAADLYDTLQNMVVSFKQNLRVINKTSNRYFIFQNGRRTLVKQEKGDSWAIRKPMHKETVFGEVNLQLKRPVKLKEAIQNPSAIVDREVREKIKEKLSLHYSEKDLLTYFEKNADTWPEVKNGKVEVYYHTMEDLDANGQPKARYFATRKALIDIVGGCATIVDAEKAIKSITDSGIQSILRAHLAAEGGDPVEAFSADGLERMNQNIRQLNGGHFHQPIKRVRKYEQSAKKRSISDKGQKATKFFEAADGTNLFYVIFTDAKGKRGYVTPPLIDIIYLQKLYEKQWKQHITELESVPSDATILYILSPGDLIYVPAGDEQLVIDTLDRSRIYKVVSCDDVYISCVPQSSAQPILNKVEYESQNKMKTTLDKQQMIREFCIPLQVDRLGNIIKIG